MIVKIIRSVKALEKSDIVFLLDFNALHRVGGDMQNTLEKYKNDFALIDHHQQPDDFNICIQILQCHQPVKWSIILLK